MIKLKTSWQGMNYPSVLLIEITSKHRDDFYCLNWIHSFRTKNKLESQKKVCEKKIFAIL